MKKLRNLSVTPPGGWRYVDPDTGYQYNQRYKSFASLIEHIKSYRAQNRLSPIPRVTSVVQHWICKQPNCEPFCGDRKRTGEQFISGLSAKVKMLVLKMVNKEAEAFEPQEIAEQRAAICVNCPENKLPTNPTFLEQLSDTYIASQVGDRKTSLDRKLFTCVICTCPLKAKVHLSQDIVSGLLSDYERFALPSGAPGLDGQPLFCWQTAPVTKGEK